MAKRRDTAVLALAEGMKRKRMEEDSLLVLRGLWMVGGNERYDERRRAMFGIPSVPQRYL